MAIIRFFKTLFSRGKKKKINKKPAYRVNRKKIKKPKRKSKRKQPKRAKKTRKKLRRKSVKKSRKTKPRRKTKTAPKRLLIQRLPKEKEIGIITHYFDKISVGIIKLKAPLAISEHIHIKGKNTDFTQVISSMQYNHKDITLAERGLEIGIKVAEPTRENDVVYKVI